jgi:hypothetical protein
MHAAKDDPPIGMEIPDILTSRQAQWGDLNVAVANIAIRDATEFFAAKLPDGRCPCPHWGYVIKGRLRVKYTDHEEVLSAGEVYYTFRSSRSRSSSSSSAPSPTTRRRPRP